MGKAEIRRYLAGLGKKGGEAGQGAAKRRGGSEYYRALSLKASKARKAKRSKE